MEELKPLHELAEPDERQRFFAMVNKATGESRQLQAKDIHERAKEAALHAGVPEEIRSHFATAQNLVAYSWFYYPFNVAAELQAYVSVEFALRNKYPGNSAQSFKTLLNRAISEGLVRSDGFTYGRNPVQIEYPPELGIQPTSASTHDYVQEVAEALRSLRNSLAHGTTTLHMKGGTIVFVCAELINQLFPLPE